MEILKEDRIQVQTKAKVFEGIGARGIFNFSRVSQNLSYSAKKYELCNIPKLYIPKLRGAREPGFRLPTRRPSRTRSDVSHQLTPFTPAWLSVFVPDFTLTAVLIGASTSLP